LFQCFYLLLSPPPDEEEFDEAPDDDELLDDDPDEALLPPLEEGLEYDDSRTEFELPELVLSLEPEGVDVLTLFGLLYVGVVFLPLSLVVDVFRLFTPLLFIPSLVF